MLGFKEWGEFKSNSAEMLMLNSFIKIQIELFQMQLRLEEIRIDSKAMETANQERLQNGEALEYTADNFSASIGEPKAPPQYIKHLEFKRKSMAT